jgi:hypothetical protein
MAGRLDHLDRMAGKIEAVTIADTLVDAGNLVGFVDRSGDGHAEAFLEREIRLDMIMMMMGRENVGQFPAAPAECVEDGLFLRRIDRRGPAALGIMEQDAEIVAASAEKFDFELGHRLSSLFV